MPRKRVTSAQVAERAGVSRTTVSLVLNNVEGTNISQATRQRVLDAAHDLGYVPNRAAQTLARGQSETLALIICQPTHRILSDAYIPQLIHGLNEVVREGGYRILIDWVEDVSQPGAYFDLARAKHIDGIILCCPRQDDSQLPRLIADGFPVVLLGRLPGIQANWVDANNEEAAELAVRHLCQLGHRRIACITNAPVEYITAHNRLDGYRKQIESCGYCYDETLVRYGNFDPDSGYTAMTSLLQLNNPPSAVFVASDVVAFGVVAAIRNHGYRIPDDIAIVSFDDVPMARYVDPPLTTVRIPAIEQGRRAGKLLIDLVRGIKPDTPQVVLDSELVVRQSCGAS